MANYIKVTDENNVYPYTYNQLLADNPNVSFPSEPSDLILQSNNMFVVEETQIPDVDYTKSISEGFPVLTETGWKQVWEVSDRTVDESNAIAIELRADAYRNESDPIFFKWQRGEAQEQDWLDKVNEIKQRYPKVE